MALFSKKKYRTQKVCFHFLYNFCLTHFSFYEGLSDTRSQMYKGLHIRYPHSCQILMKLEFSWEIFEKQPNIKFHKKPSSGSRTVSCGQTDRHDEARSRSSQILRLRLKKKTDDGAHSHRQRRRQCQTFQWLCCRGVLNLINRGSRPYNENQSADVSVNPLAPELFFNFSTLCI